MLFPCTLRNAFLIKCKRHFGAHSGYTKLTFRVSGDATLLSTLRGIFDGLTPMVTILSTIIGLFIIFVMIQSPLSPLPVPPLPYPPIGPFPPTNIYPFGVPPHHPGIPYSVRYNGPTRYAGPAVHAGTLHGGYRIPRNFKVENEKSIFNDMLQKVIESVTSSNATTMEEKLVDFFIPVLAEIWYVYVFNCN